MNPLARIGTLAPVILDAGAILGFVSRNNQVRSTILTTFAAGLPVILPTAAYVQVERGGSARQLSQTRLAELLRYARVSPLTLEIARQAGRLLGASQTTDVVDAVVVVEALQYERSIILTSDPGDLQLLLGVDPNRTRRAVRVIRV